MDKDFWERMHGGMTHFPIAMLLVSVIFDLAGFWWRDERRRRDFCVVGFYSLLIAAAASPLAVLSGLALTKGKVLGKGLMALHHYFVWPAFGLLLGLAIWRLAVRERASRRAFGCYLALAVLAAATMLGAGYWGGEMVLGNELPPIFRSLGDENNP